MIKARSRDFVLIICGLLLLVTVLVGLINSIVNTVEKISEEENIRRVLSNVKVKSTKLELIGNGNFIDSGPTIDKNVFSNYRIKLLNNGDKVVYTLNVCNNNDVDVLIYGLSIGQMTCSDRNGNIRSCDDVVGNYYLMVGDSLIDKHYTFKANTCISVVLDTEYSDIEKTNETRVKIDQFSLDLDVIKK